MGSSKSRAGPAREALEPRRRPGKERVAALLEAASAVIAEKGYEAATMAEIAARAGALVGSLYHFFPNKKALADALIRRYGGVIDEAFARIDAGADSVPIEAFSDSLAYLLVEIRGESKAMRALLDARSEWSARGDEFRNAALDRIARTLRLRAPRLGPGAARHMAVVLLQNMKSMKTLAADVGGDEARGAAAELRDMTRLYLAGKLSDGG